MANVNVFIASTHIFTRRKQTFVAALGVMVGISIYLFMNSLSSGFSAYSTGEIFKSTAHLKLYKEDEVSIPLVISNDGSLDMIVNPSLVQESKTLVDPSRWIQFLKDQPFVTNAIAQVNAEVFYKKGNSELRGTANGVNILEADSMFSISGYMKAGSLAALDGDIDGIIVGKGIADDLGLKLNDAVQVSSSGGVVRLLRVRGIFSSGNSMSDRQKSYINMRTAQQLLKKGPEYVTTIYANVINPQQAPQYAQTLQPLVPNKMESWQETAADLVSGEKVRASMMSAISMSILIVAAFGIYNILNMTVMQKMGDIAILKATGFQSKDVVRIFVMEALIMGLLGSLMGLLFGSVLIFIMQNVYMGPPVGYFPIHFEWKIYLSSLFLGMLVTFGAGYIPARRAGKVDPVEIFRK